MKSNPISPMTRDVLIGVVAVGVLGGIAYALSKSSTTTTSTTTSSAPPAPTGPTSPTDVVATPGAALSFVNPYGVQVRLPAGATWVSLTGYSTVPITGSGTVAITAGLPTQTLTWKDATGAQQQMTITVTG